MIYTVALLTTIGIALPHALRLDRSAPATATIFWAVSLASRALMAMFLVLCLAFFLPGTEALHALTHWCWHTVLPLVTTQLGLDGHKVGYAATLIPGLLVTASLLSVAFGLFRGARAVKRLVTRDALGPGPSDSVIVSGSEIMLAAAGLTRPRVVVSAGALLVLDDDELAAGLDHEYGHIARRHRFVLVFAELCRGIARFIPGCNRAMRELRFHLERDADHWALRRSHDRLVLASAICKAAGLPPAGNVAAISLSGGGASERLGQLVEDPPAAGSGAVALLLNALALGMVCVTILLAALIPSTALAGAHQHDSGQQTRHCEHRPPVPADRADHRGHPVGARELAH
jgi:bla regulator protein blaR1